MLEAVRRCGNQQFKNVPEIVKEEAMRCTQSVMSFLSEPESMTETTTHEQRRPSPSSEPGAAQDISAPVFETTASEQRIIQKYRDISRTPSRLYGKAREVWAKLVVWVEAFLNGLLTAITLEVVIWFFY
jgi:hypothetical protein